MSTPVCYGLSQPFPHGWDEHDPQCVGGQDLGADPTHFPGQVRPPCQYRNVCKGMVEPVRARAGFIELGNPESPRKQLNIQVPQRAAAPQVRVVPPPAVIQPPRTVASVQPAPAAQPTPVRVTSSSVSSYRTPPAQQPQAYTYSQPTQQMPPIQVLPIQMMPVAAEMPAYLSVPEDRGEGFWRPLGLEMFRSVGKALGHSIAHFFDHVPIGK